MMGAFGRVTFALMALGAVSACGGGGGGSGSGVEDFAGQFGSLSNDPTLASPTMQSTVDALSGTARYDGVINISTDRPSNPAGSTFYYGNLQVDIDFDDGSIDGSAGDFVQYFSEIASSKTGSGVSGSLDITGDLTATNESLGDGITGTADGTIDGLAVSYDMTGNITGVSGNGVSLSFDGEGLSGGVGLAAR